LSQYSSIRIVKKVGGTIEDIKLIDGIVLNQLEIVVVAARSDKDRKGKD